MGTGPSKLTESATLDQKSQIGVFVLGRKEKYAVDALSTILTKMLEANRLFDINRLLMTKPESPEDKTPYGCSSLFMVIQSAIESEFLRLKFQEPKVGTTITSVTTVSKQYYDDKLDERSGRSKLCKELTHFLVRLTTLVAALAASIKSNRDLLDLMKPADIEKKEDRLNRLEITDALKSKFEPVSKKVPSIFTTDSILIEKDKKELYVFKGDTDYVIDKERMLLYNASKLKTPVFRIEFGEKEEARVPTDFITTQGAPSIAPGPSALPVSQSFVGFPPAINRKPNSTTVFTGITGGSGPLMARTVTRRRRNVRRHTSQRRRRQHGGDAPIDKKLSLFTVTITYYKISKVDIFYTNLQGETYDSNIVSYIPGRGTPLPTPVPIINRLSSIFANAEASETVKYDEDEKLMDSKKEIFAGLQSYDRDTARSTISKLKESFSKINSERGEGTAPAPYRAFLLASRMENDGSITHMLCNDVWRGQWATSVMTYSLFQCLYNIKEDGQMSPDTAVECEKMVKTFVDSGAMISRPEPGKEAKGFQNLRFTPLPDVLTATVCAQTKSINPTSLERTPGDILILRKAHNDIRLAYETYVDKLIPFTMTIVKVVRAIKDGVEQEFTFRLDPAFFTTEGTSLNFLESKIAEARLLIGSHLLTVEKIYANAIQLLERSKKGVGSISTNKFSPQ